MSFKIGDVVQLKSGGPSMVIEDAEHHHPRSGVPSVRLLWTNAQGDLRDAIIPVDCLKSAITGITVDPQPPVPRS